MCILHKYTDIQYLNWRRPMSDKETGAIEGKDNKYDCANIKKFTPKKK
jgi:hypothetical protein